MDWHIPEPDSYMKAQRGANEKADDDTNSDSD